MQGTATDRAGNTVVAATTVNVDRSVPTIVATILPPPNAQGWNDANVVVTFTCADQVSGVAACPPPITVTTEGANQRFSGTVEDRAGNRATADVTLNVDRTSVSIATAVQPPPNAAGWNNTNVTVAFTCQDAGAGVKDCPAPVQVTAEGANQIVKGTATDQAGNTSTASASVSIDKTTPQITYALAPPVNAAGWLRQDARVTFTCLDAGGSGIASCAPPVTLGEGAAQSVTGAAVDIAGNTAAATATVSVDKTAPTITAAISPAPNADGWIGSDATITFTCADAISGIAACPGPIAVTTEGQQTLTGTAVDRAGNEATTSVTVNIDKTRATIVATPSPVANADGWNRTDVLVTFTCNDSGSGVSCPAPVLVTSEGAGQVITRSATDRAGNTAQASVTLNVDKSAPVIAASATPAPNAAGWNRGDVVVSFACADSLSGVVTCPAPITASAEGAGQQIGGTVTDRAGNTAIAAVSLSIDRTPPTVTIASPAAGAALTSPTVPLAGSVLDSLSGIASATCNGAAATVGAGGALGCAPALVSGPNTLTLTATDAAGNVTAAERTVTFLANHSPVANAGAGYSGVVGSPVSFSGIGSSDPDNDPLVYAWSFGDGATGSGVTVSHAYASAGRFDVTLTVTDTTGATGSAATSATIAPIAPTNQPPTAAANGPYAGAPGVPVMFSGSGSDPDGQALTYRWNFGDGGTASGAAASHVYSAANTYTATLTVSDGQLSAVSTATVQITPVVQPNRAPTAATGGPRTGETGIAVSFDGSGSTDPDNDALGYAWTFGDGSTGSGQRPSHVYSVAGSFTVTLTVTDGRGASDVATTSATIAAASDRAPPVVTLAGPTEALPGARVMMSSDATDNVGVTSVTFDVNGADPVEVSTPPYQRLVIVPEFAAPGATLKIGATARDAAGNSGTASATLTIVAEPDTVKPLVAVKVPSQAAPGSLLQVGATASDNAGVASVVLAANGTTIATLTAPPYETPYLVPLDAPVGSSITFSAQAIDRSDNRAISSALVSITQAPDTTPPTVTLAAPATATAGTAVTITATAADDTGVASVRFFLDGTRVATVVDPPYLATLSLPSTLPAGTRLHVEARAVDFSGLQSIASQDVDVVAAAAGVLTGEVYDDGSGLPVEGAGVALTGTDAHGVPYAQATVSDVHGRYVLGATEGAGVLLITKPGWSSASRAFAVAPNKGVTVVDARITPIAAGAPIAALSGGIVSGDRLAFLRVWQREVSASEDPALGLPALGGPDVLVRVPPGALASNTTLTLTPLSRQSLPGLLPPGWTPLAIVDIGPHGLALANGAAVSSPNALNVKAGTPVVFARWDEQARGWRAVASTVLTQDKGALGATVEITGEYAWVAADVVPVAPQQPAPGDLLAGVDAALIPGDASAVVNPQPKILFYKPGVKSDVRGTVTTAGAPLSSGTIVRSRITEAYQFVSSGEIHPEPIEQDLVLYQIPGGPVPVMAAGFPVSPGLTFEALSLDKGVITVELRAPEAAVHQIDVVGADGGFIAGQDGQRLDVKPGSVPQTLPIEVRSIPANQLGAVVPPGFELMGAASIAFVGTLTVPATWSMLRPAGAGDADVFLLTRLQELGGQTRFVLAGTGTLANGRLVSDTALAGTALTFEGIRVPGRYAFLRATNALAFAAGTVTVEGGAGLAGAMVSSSAVAIVSVSQPTGRYISAVALGDTTLTALDLKKTDTVSAPVTASAPRQVIALDLALAARPPTVTSVTPADGAVNIALADPIVVRFSSPIDAATATLQSVRLSSGSGVVVGALALTANNTIATLRAVDPLQPNTAYTLTLSQAIADPFGRSLPSPFSATFTSLDTIAPLPPTAGSITTSIPGADGKTRIDATQGTAGAHDTVVIKNLGTGKITPVILDANGGFTAIAAAAVTDRLQLIITDAAGNKTTVALPRFRQTNADGTISQAVGPEGGRLDGPGGVGIDVPAGAFPVGAVLKFGPVTEADFPFHLDAQQRLLFQYSGGFRLDFGGTVPTRYVNVSVPTIGGETSSDQWLVMQAIQVGGQSSLSAIDTARVIDGRITTSSPPCPGVTGTGVYGFLKSARPLGVVYGPVTVDRTLPPGVFIPFLVGPGLISFPMGIGDLLTPGIDGSISGQDPLGLGNYISAAAETAAVFSRAPACLPLLSGRATMAQNRFTIVTPTAQLTPADRELEVVNVTRLKTTHFFRPFQPTLSIEGGNADALIVTAIDVAGNRRTMSTTSRPHSFVHVLVASTEFTHDDQEITIQNLTGTRSFSSGIGTNAGRPLLDVNVVMEGEAGDQYVAEVRNAAGVKRPVTFGVLPYAYGNGNLRLRVAPGTIDPTLAEINAFNALVPPDQQLPVTAAVTKVVLQIDTPPTSSTQEIIADANAGDTARLVGGAFEYAVEGTFDKKYTLHVLYANGNSADVKIPMFRVTLTNPTTGAVVNTVTAPVPPPHEPLFLDLSPPTGATEVTSPPASLRDVDPRTPITLVFSRALDKVSVDANLILFGTNSLGVLTPVAGTWKLSQGNRVVSFVPAGALRFNETYRVALGGVADIAGHGVAGSSVLVTTFRPRKFATKILNEPPTGQPVPLKDVSFLRQPGPGGKVETHVVAATANKDGFKLHTIDVTDPRHPLEKGHTAGGSYKRRMTLLPGIAAPSGIDIMYEVQLVPQQTGMSCWAAGAAMLVGWRDRVSIDPIDIAARLGYGAQYEVDGLSGSDTEMFRAWGLVPEPPQSFSVASFKQMLEDFGPLWVASAVPSAHIRVVTGMIGDGTPDGTTVYINDPWQAGMTSFALPNEGATDVMTYTDFQAQQEKLARQWFGDIDVMRQLCKSGNDAVCKGLKDPPTLELLRKCSTGDTAACLQLHLPGGPAFTVAHLSQKPAWVPPIETGALKVRLPLAGEPPLATCTDHVVTRFGRQYFNGDLAVTSSWNLDSNYFTFFDVTDPAQPCVIGDKTITANPERVNSFNGPGTYHIQGSARGLTTIHHADGYAAYMAIAEAGLFAVDIGGSIPSVFNPKDRQQEGFYSGDFADVVAVRDRLLALSNNYGGDATLEVLDPNLSPIASSVLTNGGTSGTKQHRIVYTAGSWVDVNRNGRKEPGEVFDLAFVAGTGGIIVVDITNLDLPKVVGRIQSPNIIGAGGIQTPGILREIAIDAGGKMIFAGGDRGNVASPGGAPVPVSGDAFFMIDASNPFAAPVVDAGGHDSRIVFEYGYPDGIGGLSVDSQRGLVYVGWPASNVATGALDIWASDRTARVAFNTPPAANAGPDADVDQNRPVTLDGSRSADPDGDPLTYAWTQIGGPTVSLSDPAAMMPTFVAPAIDGAVLSFKLIVNDGVVNSPADTVVLTVRAKARLELRPVIVPIVVVPGTKQLALTLTPLGGAPPRNVVADTHTTYRWLGNGLISGTDGLPDMAPILNMLASKLGVPVVLADISVSASGLLTVNTPGIQVVRAHYKDATDELDSGFTVVLAGITLKSIALKPESLLTTLAGTLSEAMGSKKNPPMILAAHGNDFLAETGVVLLDDVTFELLGTATISLKDLVDAIAPLVQNALTAALAETGPAAPVLAHAFTKLAELGLSFAGVQALNPLASADVTIATITDTVPLQGFVTSHAPGLTSITGTLNLGALGKADDSVLVWVLPNVQSVTVEPNLTVIRATDPPTPGPTVRTFVEVELIHQAIVPLKGKATTTAELLDRFLPDGLASWQATLDKNIYTNTPVPGLRFHLRGSVTPTCAPPDVNGDVDCSITFTDVGLGFYAPNNARPAIANDYAIGDSTIAALGSVDTFDTHIVHQHTVGASPLTGTVAVAFMGGSQDPTARIVVAGSGPVLTKTRDGDASVQGGDFVNFTVTVINPFETPLLNVQVTDTEYFTARGVTAEAVIQSVVLPSIAVLAPHQTVTIDASLTGFVAPSVPGLLRNEVTAVGSAPASATVTVNVDTLHLVPRLIIAPNAPRTTPLTVTMSHSGGTTEDVTRDPRTTYEWIGKNVPSDVVDAIYGKINAALVADGQPPLPAQLADVSVDPLTGVLSINRNGLQLVRASYGGLPPSEIAVVLAGIQLKTIDLVPLSKLNAIQSALVDLKNPPMMLASDAPSNDAPFDTTGQVVLRDARFEILGGPATISAKKLVDALASAAGDAVTAFTLETGPLAKVFGWAATQLLTGVLDEAGTQLLEPVSSTDPLVATVVGRSGASLPAMPVGRVDAHASGLADIKGTLDLGDYGQASDNVLTWVLPALTSATIEPAVTIIDLAQVPAPDPKVRTFATVSAGITNVPIPLSGRFNDVAQAVDRFLPGGWAGSGAGTFTLATGRVHVNAPVNNFVFSLQGTATVGCAQAGAPQSGCSVTLTNLVFGFHVPHAPPVVTDAYVVDPLIATATTDANRFDTHIAAVSVGRSTLESHVDMTALKMDKATDPDGLVIVIGGTKPVVVEKRVLGSSFALVPGGSAQFEILFANATAGPIVDVSVTDTLLFNGTVKDTRTLFIGTVPPNEGRRLVIPVTAPVTSGVLENQLDFTGCLIHPCMKVVLPVRGPIINELVVEPQRDWDDSGLGGNGVPFDNTPGAGVAPAPAVTAGDQWIEFLTNTGSPAELTNYTLSFTDTSGTPHSVTLGPGNLISTAGSPYVLIGAPGGIAPGSLVQLRDTTNTVVDEVDLAAVHAALGFATGVGDEAIARAPDGFDTGAVTDFTRKPATIRKPNP